MAAQAPDRTHAWATFVPVDAAPLVAGILNSDGIASFVRNSPGNYTVTLTDPLAFASALASASIPANFLAVCGAQIAPGGAEVLLTAHDLAGAPVDPPWIGLRVSAVREGEGVGPQPALPGPPAPPSSSGLTLGWVRVKATGAFTQSASGIVASVAPWAGLPGVSLITLVGGTVAGAVVVSQDLNGGTVVSAGTPIAEVLSPTTINVQAGTGPTPGTDYYAAILGA
jgi:hypothetical protein